MVYKSDFSPQKGLSSSLLKYAAELVLEIKV